MSNQKVLTIVGARPQFIKAAAVSRAFRKHTSIEEKIIHTGQHYDANMSDVFFDGLGIPTPAFRFEFGGLSHGQMTGRMIEALEGVFIKEKPEFKAILDEATNIFKNGKKNPKATYLATKNSYENLGELKFLKILLEAILKKMSV